MSLLSRLALVAVAIVSLGGVIAPGSTAQAAELAHVALVAPTVVSMNIPTGDPVPAEPATTDNPEAPLKTAAVQLSSELDFQPGDSIAYPSLAAAVAAQSGAGETDDLRCLATSIYFESKGEPLAGQLAVAQVILNRAQSKRFGSGVCGVVTQRGQFSFVKGGRVPEVDASRPAYRTALAVAKVALADAWDSPAPNALYFHARRIPASFARPRVAAIGNHIFYR